MDGRKSDTRAWASASACLNGKQVITIRKATDVTIAKLKHANNFVSQC